MIQVDSDGNAILNDAPKENRDQAAAVANLPEAASADIETEQKDLLRLTDYPQENLRAPLRIQQNEEPRNEEKYVAQMPNGAWCVISHDDGKVIKCFDTEKEAEAYLGKKSASPSRNTSRNMWMYDTIEAAERRAKEIGCEGYHEHEVRGTTYYMPCASHESFERTKKSYLVDIMEELKVSLEEAEVIMESQFSIEPENVKEKPKKDRTNFPSPGDDKQVSISNSKYKQFPYGYAKDLKENWPEIWRRAGNGGNPPTSFTGNDAFRNWTKYKSGDRSESVLNWVRRRERYMGRHQGNNRLNGTIANIKWGGVSNIGVSAMKKIINDQKKVVRSRRKAAADLAEQMADDIALKAVSGRIKKILSEKAKNHNAKNPKHRTNARTLAAVFNRGVGAYRTNPGSVRGNVTSADQWGLARVNGFLHALRTGRFKRKPYDQDLLPSSHPLSSKKSGEKAASVRVGQSVSWSINKDPDPPSTVHGVVTSVGDGEATMQVYAILESGKHKKTDRKVTMPISKLTVIKDIKDE
tara:strand:- start:515 stop:2086 length:1572 start_codon:yes stop_codon:yes gene_type:complete